MAASLLGRIPTNVVHHHGLRIGQAAGRSTQGATNGHIQDCENTLIEWPYISRREDAGRSREERRGCVIHVELHLVLRPNYPVGMERSVRCFSAGEGVAASDSIPSSLRSMNRGIVPGRACSTIHLRRPVLHDVRFSASWPGNRGDIAAQGPEGGPEALVCGVGELDTGHEDALSEVLFPFRLHAARDPRSTHVSRLDHEVTAAIDIDGSGGSAERCRALGWIA